MVRYEAFCKIMELGSFTKAAESLGYTQAAVSQMIHSLERDLGVVLLTRSRTGIKLTAEGELLFPLIQKAVRANKDVVDISNEIQGLSMGEVRIGAFTSISQHWLPILIKNFELEHPGIKFVLYQGDNKTIPEWINEGIVDFGFIYPRAARDLEVVSLARESYLAVVPENHNFAAESEVPLSALVDQPLIIIEEGTEDNTVIHAFNEAGLTPEKVKYKIHDDYTILSMVEQGLGISILPAIIPERTTYRFKAVPITPTITRNIGVAFQSMDLVPIAAKHFLNFLFANLPKIPMGKYIAVSNTTGITIN